MIKVNKAEREALESVGLLRSRRTGYNACDANYTVVNREHLGRSKKTYVTEEPEIMLFLGRYEGLNLQRINQHQYKELWDKGFLNRSNIQTWGRYTPNAIAFQDAFGQWRIKKISKLMFELGIWTNNRQKKFFGNSSESMDQLMEENVNSSTVVENVENIE